MLLVAVIIVSAPLPGGTNRPAGATPAPVPVDEVVPAEIVDLQYRDLLGRPADATGREFWATMVASGRPVAEVIESMLDSQEVGGAYEPTIRLYRAAFLRPPDYQGLNYWVRAFRSGVSMEAIAGSFADSTEFQCLYGQLDNREFVGQIYRNVLGREAETAGLDYWVGLMARGTSRGRLLLAFSEGSENLRKTSVSTRMSLLTATLLRRVPTRDEVATWERQKPSTATRTLIDRVLATREYRVRLATTFPARHPLTGQATVKVAPLPALAVKIDNVDAARPPIGLGMADIVYEEMVEGNLTRLIAIYHSQAPTTVGPVRSVRVSDFDVLAPYNRPLLAASGANPGVLRALQEAPVVNVNALVADDYWRDERRVIPHNLLTSPAALWERSPDGSRPPPTVLRTGKTPSIGGSSPGVKIEFGRASVEWTWETETGVWRRTQNGHNHIDAYGVPIGAENVVIMITGYTTNSIDANSPEAHTVGSGRALILTADSLIDGSWERLTAAEPIGYFDGTGRPVTLRRGQTWVELAPPGSLTLEGGGAAPPAGPDNLR